MPIEVMTIRPSGTDTRAESQAREVSQRLNEWLKERPGVRVINIETLLVRNGSFVAPYDGEELSQLVRVWMEVPERAQ